MLSLVNGAEDSKNTDFHIAIVLFAKHRLPTTNEHSALAMHSGVPKLTLINSNENTPFSHLLGHCWRVAQRRSGAIDQSRLGVSHQQAPFTAACSHECHTLCHGRREW